MTNTDDKPAVFVKRQKNENQVVLEKKKPNDYRTVAQKISGDPMVNINFEIKELREAFPFDVKMWCVRKMFPYAEGGPVYIDEPYHKEEIERCQKKIDVMTKQGYRYFIVQEGTKLIHGTMD